MFADAVPAVIAYERSTSGHRASYLQICERLLGATALVGSPSYRLVVLLRARHLIATTCDDYLPFFLLLVAARTALGRATTGITIRADAALDMPGGRGLLRRLCYSIISRIPRARLLSIMPYDAEPRLSAITSSWIWDPQFWDLMVARPAELPRRTFCSFAAGLNSAAQGRLIVGFIGSLSRYKAAESFLQTYIMSPELRRSCFFVAFGVISDISTDLLTNFREAGGHALNDYPTEAELIAAYDLCDLVWCAYAPFYNRSSGIFGRACQLGKAALVRRNSRLHYVQRRLGYEITIRGESAEVDACSIVSLVSDPECRTTFARAGQIAQATLHAAAPIERFRYLVGGST